jgi:hypothetical protein
MFQKLLLAYSTFNSSVSKKTWGCKNVLIKNSGQESIDHLKKDLGFSQDLLITPATLLAELFIKKPSALKLSQQN